MRRRCSTFFLALLVASVWTAALSLSASSRGLSSVFPQGRLPELVLPLADHDSAKAPSIRIGIISYWDLASPAWDNIPADSTVLINPNSGILQKDSEQAVQDASGWGQLVDRLRKKNIAVLAYVPTGYFTHDHCKKGPEPECQTKQRISLQVKTYYQLIPSLAGIFYDETSPKEGGPSDYNQEYSMLRSINSAGRITVFNVGWSSEEAVKATKAGEHLVLYESAPFGYEKDAAWITTQTLHARDKGIIVWHLLHSVCREDMCSFVAKMAERGANYGYITNIGGDWKAGENTWGSLPRYWDEEPAAFLAPKPCEPKK